MDLPTSSSFVPCSILIRSCQGISNKNKNALFPSISSLNHYLLLFTMCGTFFRDHPYNAISHCRHIIIRRRWIHLLIFVNPILVTTFQMVSINDNNNTIMTKTLPCPLCIPVNNSPFLHWNPGKSLMCHQKSKNKVHCCRYVWYSKKNDLRAFLINDMFMSHSLNLTSFCTLLQIDIQGFHRIRLPIKDLPSVTQEAATQERPKPPIRCISDYQPR